MNRQPRPAPSPDDARRLIGGGIRISRFGLGTAPLAGLFRSVAERDAVAAIETALDLGVTYFDTAPQYGAGVAERRLGRALSGQRREEVVVSTKVGRRLEPSASPVDSPWVDADPLVRDVFDFSAVGVRESLEDSLDRLGLDRADIVLIHDPDNHLEEALDEALPALVELRQAGLCSAIGVGTNRTATARRFLDAPGIDVVLLAGRYTVLDRSAEVDVLPTAFERRVPVIAGGVFNSGVLADPAPDATFDYHAVTPSILATAQRMAALTRPYSVPLIAAALQFPLRNPAVACVLVGCRSAAEVAANVRALDLHIPNAAWDDLLAESRPG